MKKRILHKLLATGAVAFLFVGGIFAQTHNGTAVPGAIANYAGSDAQATTVIMEGTTVPMWVRPDSYYHPNYNPGTSTWTLTNGFTWTFSGSAATNLTVTQASTDDNYVTVAAAAGDAGAYVLSVTENAPAAYGSCAGPQVDLNITVVEAPTATLGGNATYAFCAGNPGLPSAIDATISGGWQNYRLVWNLEIATLNASGVKEFYYDNAAGLNRTNTQKYAVEYTEVVPQEIAASGATSIMTVASFPVIDNNGVAAGGNAVTVYTYNLVSINDQASRFGDFIGLAAVAAPANDDFTYLATAETVTVTVYPAPATGPIFHISDNWQE